MPNMQNKNAPTDYAQANTNVNVSATGGSSSVTMNVTGTGATAGDALLMWFMIMSSTTVATPTGWTLQENPKNGNGNAQGALFSLNNPWNGTTNSYTVTMPATVRNVGIIMAIPHKEIEIEGLVTASAIGSSTAATSFATPALTPARDGLLLLFHAARGSSSSQQGSFLTVPSATTYPDYVNQRNNGTAITTANNVAAMAGKSNAVQAGGAAAGTYTARSGSGSFWVSALAYFPVRSYRGPGIGG